MRTAEDNEWMIAVDPQCQANTRSETLKHRSKHVRSFAVNINLSELLITFRCNSGEYHKF